jgi:hypothetical protein
MLTAIRISPIAILFWTAAIARAGPDSLSTCELCSTNLSEREERREDPANPIVPVFPPPDSSVSSSAQSATTTQSASPAIAVLEAVRIAKRQPAPVIVLNPGAKKYAGTLWFNLTDPDAEAVLDQAITLARNAQVDVRLIAFGQDPATTGKTVLFHMMLEHNRVGQQPDRLLALAREFRGTSYFELVDRHKNIPSCMRVAARNRIDTDLEEAQQTLTRLDKSRLVLH